MEVLEAIQQRHSVRQYTTQVVEEEKLQTISDAINFSSTSYIPLLIRVSERSLIF